MYMLKVCRCCDAIIGELETDDRGTLATDSSVEVMGNVAFALCPHCMQELNISEITYYQ